jgi:hypothetical protein
VLIIFSASPPNVIAIASSYGPKFFLALFDFNTSTLTPLANFPSTTDLYAQPFCGPSARIASNNFSWREFQLVI